MWIILGTEELSVFIAPLSSFTQKLVGGMHLPHSKIGCLTECVTEMPVSDTQNFGKLTSMRLQWTPGQALFPLPSAPETRVPSTCASLGGHKDGNKISH